MTNSGTEPVTIADLFSPGRRGATAAILLPLAVVRRRLAPARHEHRTVATGDTEA